MRHKETSWGESAYVLATLLQETARFMCFNGTRLGRPVLPLVCSTKAISSGEGLETEVALGASTLETIPRALVATENTGTPSCWAARRASSAPSAGQSRSRAALSSQ